VIERLMLQHNLLNEEKNQGQPICLWHTEAALNSNKRKFWIQYSDFSDASANVPVDL